MKLFLSLCALITLANAQFGGFGGRPDGIGPIWSNNGHFGPPGPPGPGRSGPGRPPVPPSTRNFTVADENQIACIITNLQTLNASNTNYTEFFGKLVAIPQQVLTDVQSCKTQSFYEGVRCVINLQLTAEKKAQEVLRSLPFAGRKIGRQVINTFKNCLSNTNSTTSTTTAATVTAATVTGATSTTA